MNGCAYILGCAHYYRKDDQEYGSVSVVDAVNNVIIIPDVDLGNGWNSADKAVVVYCSIIIRSGVRNIHMIGEEHHAQASQASTDGWWLDGEELKKEKRKKTTWIRMIMYYYRTLLVYPS